MRVVLRDLWQRGITKRQDLLPMSGGCLRVCKLFVAKSNNRLLHIQNFLRNCQTLIYVFANTVPQIFG